MTREQLQPRRLSGTPGDDVLAATADGQLVLGLAGHDTLTSTFNRTTLAGGLGNDILTTTLDAGGTFEDPPADLDARQLGGAGADELTIDTRADQGEIRNVADGGGGDDYVDVAGDFTTGGVVRNVVSGGAGSDAIYATADMGDLGNLALNRIAGGSGSDIIVADAVNGFNYWNTVARNVIDGGSGNDAVIAFASTTPEAAGLSENIVHAGLGHDYVEVTTRSGSNVDHSPATNRVFGGDGHDRISSVQTGSGEDGSVTYSTLLDGGSGNDRLTAENVSISENGFGSASLQNVLIGGIGNDDLTATASASHYNIISVINRLSGGRGNDVLAASVFADTVSGEDRLGQNILQGGTGNDQLTAAGGLGNLLAGGSGDDDLSVVSFGDANDSRLNGGSGRDTLEGGFGDDLLLGGADADTFVFDVSPFAGDQGTDRIGDLDGAEDRLAFRLFEDAGAPGLTDDLDAITTVTDAGAGLDVTVEFTTGTTLVFAGVGTGLVDSLADLVDDPLDQLLLA
jgi:Ca2+-binding RTX toxin-like protein